MNISQNSTANFSLNHFKEKRKIIAIVGLMGVGKTTLGTKLADKFGYYFIDLDREIEDFEQKSVREIFEEKGEKYFRELEKKLATEIVARDEQFVLSLGGGAFMDYDIREMLLKNALVIWLKAPIDVVLHRLGNKNNRPLLNNVNKRQVLEDLEKKRYPLYSQAHLEFDSAALGYENIIEEIENILK